MNPPDDAHSLSANINNKVAKWGENQRNYKSGAEILVCRIEEISAAGAWCWRKRN